MDSYIPTTPVSPNSRSVTANSSPYTTYTRHHRKRISALRLSSDTTSTLPEYIPTNPNIPSVAHWQTVPEATEIDDAPPGYSSDSAQEADEDTDLSDEDRRRQIQRSVLATVGINSAPATATTFTSSPSLRASRPKLSHRRKRSNPTLSLDPIQSNSDLYLDSLLERSVHALEMSNVLLQSSMSTKTSLSGILYQDTDEEEPMVPSSAMRPSSSRSVAGSGMNSLERSARGLSARIMGGGYVHETWIEDLEQIGKDVDQLFSEEAQKERRQRNRTRHNGSHSGSSQGSISSSLPVVSSTPLQSYNKFDRDRIAHSSGTSPQQHSNQVSRRTLIDLRSHSQTRSFSNPNRPEHLESLKRHNVMAGVPHLRYDVQDRERFISQPPRALTQYVVIKGDLTHGHEEENSFHHQRHQNHRRNSSGGLNGDGNDNNSDDGWREGPIGKETEQRKNDEDEPIVLPSTIGLRSLGTHSTIRRNKQLMSCSQSPSPEQSVSRLVHHHDDQLSIPSIISTPTIVLDPSSSLPTHSSFPTRAPNAYNMLSSFVYPASSSSSNLTPKRSDSSSSNSRPKGKTSPFASPWASRRSSVNSTAAESPSFGATSGTNGHGHFARRRHSTSPAASMMSNRTTCTTRSGGSGSSSTITAGSSSRSRSQTPKPLESGPILTTSGRRHMTPPLEVSSNSGSGGEGNCSERREESDGSSDSCPTKQTILSLRKILDTHIPPEKLSSDDWTLISKPPLLLQQSSKAGVPVEAGTSNATASISKLFTRGVHSHEGSVTRRYDEQRQSSFKGKGKATSTDSAASSAPSTPITTSRVPALTPNKMSFDNIPKLLGTSVALALGASSPLSSTPSSGASTPATPSHLKRISFAELPEGTQGSGSNRKSRKRKGKQKASGSRLSNGHRGASYSKQSGSDDDEGDEPRGWLRWLINAAGVDSGRPDKIDERLGKGWGSASRGPGYGGMDEWGI
ncbi:hypothetical protein F5876DRAFT_73432 [Lentinula aff. lateritia]|uniref:Uncharacterized protein n=1 Tax=Lentinula aff. lateritia TaxID=2804960 RepID=A0ACC1UAX1_9AGAR|nr:hypothetical protein F5876DRAFT_73432 [Lentinula aff. lateritia]